MKVIFYILLVLAAAVGSFLLVRPKPLLVETALVQAADFLETLTADGKVRAKTKQTLYAFASGNIDRISFKIGDLVKKDQVLANIVWEYDRQMKSPFDGVVSKVYRESPGPIQRAEPVVEISSLKDLEIVVDLLTTDAVRVNQGSSAKVINWGKPEPLPALVTRVSRAGTVKISALGVEEERTEVTLNMQKVPTEILSRLGDMYHVDVVFQISEIKQARVIPLGALFKAGEKWAVYTIEGDRAHLKQIDIGPKNERQVVVSSGLNADEKVILFPGDRVHEGALVTAK